MNKNEIIIYPALSVQDGLIAASPELLIELGQRAADRGFTEGDISLRVNYEDLKNLAAAAGYTIKEIVPGVQL